MNNFFQQLPKEIQEQIFSFFTIQQHFKNKSICKQWKKLLDDAEEKEIMKYSSLYSGKDYNAKNRALISAVTSGDLYKIIALQRLGANLHLQQPAELGYGQTLLHIAAKKNNPFVLKYLLNAGVKTDTFDAAGKTAKDLALKSQFQDIVQILENSTNLCRKS